jgi:hypothetical protein
VPDSGSFAIAAVYGSAGQYLAQYIPQLAGTYTLTISLLGLDEIPRREQISGSPWTTIVAPGEIAPIQSNHSITTLPMDLTAGITMFFTITTKDMYSNLIKDKRDNTTVTINATYTDHNDWLSPLPGVPDLYDWERIYGRDIAGLAIFNNRSNSEPHSSYTAQLTIFRAGKYSLDIMINGKHVIASPQIDQTLVKPALLYAPACIVDGLPLTMVAGSSYTFQIQTRDFYSNNLKSLLGVAVQSWQAEILSEYEDDGAAPVVAASGTIVDKPSDATDYSGVYDVTFSPTIAGRTFAIKLTLNGLDVDNTAEYRNEPLVVEPAPLTSASHTNYTILTAPDQSQLQYVDQEASRSYTYVTGDTFHVLIDARDAYTNLRYDSAADVYTVLLAGQTTGTAVSG